MAESQNIVKIRFKPEGDKNLVRAIQTLDIHTKSLIGTQAGLQQSQRDSRNEMTKMLKSLRSTGMDFKKLGISVDVLNKAYQGHTTSIDRTRIAYERYKKFLKSVGVSTQKNTIINEKASKGLFELGHSARQTGGAFSVLRSKLLLFNFAMGLGIRQLMRFAEEASKLEALETAFNTLSGGVDNAGIALDKLKESTDGTVSSMDLFQQANNAMILGVTKNSDEMAEMFDMAQRLGRALGRDTRSSIESFVTGVGRQSRLMLDNIGLIVKAEVAYKAFANEVGKSTDELDEMERKQAFLNASLFAGEQALRSLGEEQLSSADKLQQMSTQLIEVRQQLGEELLPFVLEATKAVKEFAENIDGDDIRNAISTIETLTVAFVSFKAIVATTQGFVALLSLSFPQVALIASVASAIGALGVEYQKSSKRAMDLKSAQDDLRTSFKNTKKELDDYIKFNKNYEKSLLNAQKQIQAETDVIIEANAKAFKSFDSFLKRLRMSKEELDSIRKEEAERSRAFSEITEGLSNKQKEQFKDQINVVLDFYMKKFKQDKKREQNEKRLLKLEETKAKARAKLLEIEQEAEKISLDEKNRNREHNFEEERARILQRIEILRQSLSDEKEILQQVFNEFLLINTSRTEKENEAHEEHKRRLDERAKLEKLVFGETNEFQLEAIDKLEEKFLQHFEHTLESQKFFEDARKKIMKKGTDDATKLALQATQSQIDGLNMLAGSINALSGAFDVLSDSQASASAKMGAFLRMAGGLLSVLGDATPAGAFGGVLSAFGGAIGHTGGYIKQDGSIQKFATGGMVQGQDNVPIMAQAGEFIIRRSVVDDIGVDKLAELNNGQTGVGSTININIDGNVIGNEEFVRGTLIPEIRRTIGRGLA